MSFMFDPEKLQGHPCVYSVDPWKLALTYDFRVRLYKAWKPEQKPAEILSILQEEGLTEDLVGKDYFLSVAHGFKMSGYPLPRRPEIAARQDYAEENPLILSGKFTRSRRGKGSCLKIDESFLKEI